MPCGYKTKDVVPVSSDVRQTRGGSLPYDNDVNREVISGTDKGPWSICMRTERYQEKAPGTMKIGVWPLVPPAESSTASLVALRPVVPVPCLLAGPWVLVRTE